MRFFSSLRNRIFLTSAVLTVLSIGAAIYVVNVRLTQQAERALQREIIATGTLVDQLRTTRRRSNGRSRTSSAISSSPRIC